MDEIKACYTYNSPGNTNTVKREIVLPLETAIEEIVHILLLHNNLPIYKDRGNLITSSCCTFYQVKYVLFRVNTRSVKICFETRRRIF